MTDNLKMTSKELYEYIVNKKCYCEFCRGLQDEVQKSGLMAIKEWDGMICGGVEDMRIRYYNLVEDLKDV